MSPHVPQLFPLLPPSLPRVRQQAALRWCLVCLWSCGSWNDWGEKRPSLTSGELSVHFSEVHHRSFKKQNTNFVPLWLFLQQLWHRRSPTSLQKQHRQPHLNRTMSQTHSVYFFMVAKRFHKMFYRMVQIVLFTLSESLALNIMFYII